MIDWWGSEETLSGKSCIGDASRRIRGKQVVQRPVSEGGNEDNLQLNPEGSFRKRSALAFTSRVKEGCGSCASRLDLLGMNLESKLYWGLCVCNAGNGGLHHVRAGQYVCVELVRARDLDSWQRKRQLLDERSGGRKSPADELLRERLFGITPGQREDARARMSSEDAPAATGEEAVEEDLRTLWIDRDDQEQGFKEWKKVCSESSEERQPTVPWRVLPRVSRCVNRCSNTEETPSCGCTCG